MGLLGKWAMGLIGFVALIALCNFQADVWNWPKPQFTSGDVITPKNRQHFARLFLSDDMGKFRDVALQGQPSKFFCRLSHAPLLAPIAIAAFLGLIAGVALWKAVGLHIERGLLDSRTMSWFASALGVYALAILLAFVSGQAYKYKTGINRYYCAYHVSSNLSV